MHGHLASVCRPRGCGVQRWAHKRTLPLRTEKSPNRRPLQRLTVRPTGMINHYRFEAWAPTRPVPSTVSQARRGL